jgi:shikimate kinase
MPVLKNTEHAFCGKFEKLLMNVLGQKTVVVELGGGLSFGRENR